MRAFLNVSGWMSDKVWISARPLAGGLGGNVWRQNLDSVIAGRYVSATAQMMLSAELCIHEKATSNLKLSELRSPLR